MTLVGTGGSGKTLGGALLGTYERVGRCGSDLNSCRTLPTESFSSDASPFVLELPIGGPSPTGGMRGGLVRDLPDAVDARQRVEVHPRAEDGIGRARRVVEPEQRGRDIAGLRDRDYAAVDLAARTAQLWYASEISLLWRTPSGSVKKIQASS